MSLLTPLLRVSFIAWRNKLSRGGIRARFFSVTTGIFLSLFALALYYFASVSARNGELQVSELASGTKVGFFAVFLMLLLSNFACGLAAFFGAQDIPLLLALPISRARLLLGRGTVSIWNASWSALIFIVPLFLGLLRGNGVELGGMLLGFVGLTAFVLTSGVLGILLAVIFVNIVPMFRLLEFVAVILTVAILFFASFSGHIENNPKGLAQISERVFETQDMKAMPPAVMEDLFIRLIKGEEDFTPFLRVLFWLFTSLSVTALMFERLFLRGWDLAFGAPRRQRVLTEFGGRRSFFPWDTQLLALIKKEQRMFLRDASQVVQLFVILFLTFIYLFNIKNLKLLNFAVEESSYWWQGVLGLANICLGGCVAAAITTRFVFPSVSLEGRAYVLLRITPLSLPKLLLGKCVAWFIPVGGVITTLLVTGALSLQLPEIAIFYTSVVAISLAVGLVGLGVGMGAVHAKFDWDHVSSLYSGFGNLLYMLLAFVLIFVTLLPTGFLYFLVCVPSFAADIGATELPIFFTLITIIGINVLVARGAVLSGVNRLLELEQG